MSSHQQGKILKVLLWVLAGPAIFVFVAFAGMAIYNTIDEDLSAEAQALLEPPGMGKVEDSNGFIAFLGMGAPKGQDQMEWGRKAAAAYMAQAQPDFVWGRPEWKEATKSHIKIPDSRKQGCIPEQRDCLAGAKADGDAVAKWLEENDNALLLARYRKARDGATFSDLYIGVKPAANIPGYSALFAGATLALADSAMRFRAGNLEAVVVELEREVAFHRRIITNGRTIIAGAVGSTLLARDLLAISELLRSEGARVAPYRARLAALTRPQVSAAAIAPAFRTEAHTWVTFAHGIRAILRDNSGWKWTSDIRDNVSPLTNWVQSWLARPNETANLVAALATIDVSIVSVPAAQFGPAPAAIDRAKAALTDWPWYEYLRNPVGRTMIGDSVNLGVYAARMHDLHALERMVDMQLALAARGITDSAAMTTYIAGEGAQSHADPYTGKAFAFDPEKRLLSFEPRAKGSWNAALKKRYGKVGIAL